ncbi:MAG: hypothetical protein ACTSRP_26635 [Candidatus Helarchaeota archaeon]
MAIKKFFKGIQVSIIKNWEIIAIITAIGLSPLVFIYYKRRKKKK